MRGFDACRTYATLQPEVEIGCIDADEQVGTRLDDSPGKRLPQAQQTGQVVQYLEQPHHRQFVRWPPALHAGACHARASHTYEAGMGVVPLDGFDERAAQLIARGLAGHQGNYQAVARLASG